MMFYKLGLALEMTGAEVAGATNHAPQSHLLVEDQRRHDVGFSQN